MPLILPGTLNPVLCTAARRDESKRAQATGRQADLTRQAIHATDHLLTGSIARNTAVMRK